MQLDRRTKILARIEKRKGPVPPPKPCFADEIQAALKTPATWDEFCAAMGMGIESKLREPEIEYPDRNKSVPMGARPYRRRKAGR